MKTAKKRNTYPAISLSREAEQIIDTDLEQQGYSNSSIGMREYGDYLRRAIAFERKRSTGK